MIELHYKTKKRTEKLRHYKSVAQLNQTINLNHILEGIGVSHHITTQYILTRRYPNKEVIKGQC